MRACETRRFARESAGRSTSAAGFAAAAVANEAAACRGFYAFFARPPLLSPASFHAQDETSCASQQRKNAVDAVFLLIAIVLWLLMAAMAWGAKRLANRDGAAR
jgi:hypothetical protein